MSREPCIAIFSDLHLQGQNSAEEKLFIQLLRRLRHEEEITHLWLLGDIFDFLVGPFEFWTQRHQDFFQELDFLRAGQVQMLWIEGNHDFYLERLLAPRGVECVDGEVRMEIEGRSVYLAHGDLVNQQDHNYLRWRSFTRSIRFRSWIEKLPEALRRSLLPRVGAWLSKQSRRQGEGRNARETQALYKEFARQQWACGHDSVFLGHSHWAEDLREDERFYLNLGSWVNDSPRFALWRPRTERFPKTLFS